MNAAGHSPIIVDCLAFFSTIIVEFLSGQQFSMYERFGCRGTYEGTPSSLLVKRTSSIILLVVEIVIIV